MAEQATRPRVLLARLTPVASVGMRCMLTEYGVDVVGQEDRPLAIEAIARELEPDAVVMALEPAALLLCERIRNAAPFATVILWSAEENRIQVIGPGESAIREITPEYGELRRELIASQSRNIQIEE
jgi:AmiR/NasT family two-component response regulator